MRPHLAEIMRLAPLEQRHEQLLGLSALSSVELLTDALLVEVFDRYGNRDTEAMPRASAVA